MPKLFTDREIEHHIELIKEAHPWIGDSLMNVAPGHLDHVREMFKNLEKTFGDKHLFTLSSGLSKTKLVLKITYDEEGEMLILVTGLDVSAMKEISNKLQTEVRRYCGICGKQKSNSANCLKHEQEWKDYIHSINGAQSNIDSLFEETDSNIDMGSFFKSKAPPSACIFRDSAVADLRLESTSADSDSKNRIRALAQKLNTTNGIKPLATLPVEWQAKLDELAVTHPNFEEFLDFLRGQFALAAMGDSRISIPPVLFSGPPGVGKTEIVLTLAALIKTGFLQIDMAGAQSGSTLTGSEEFWANSREGKFFTLLTQGETANPIVFLDELDKVSGDQRYTPSAGLYQLLEPATAKDFRDLSIPSLSLDASHVIWFAACNNPHKIDQPIKSRFIEFEISEPDFDQSILIANAIYKRIINSNAWGKKFDSALDDDVAILLAKLSPRLMRTNLTKAFGVAAGKSRTYLLPDDLSSPAKKRIFGFV